MCDGIRTDSRGESARQEILTSLVSALDSLCMAMSRLNAEVLCVTVHEDSVVAVGTEKGRLFLNSRREIQSDFYKFCRPPGLQNPTLNPTPGSTKDQDPEARESGADGEAGKVRAPDGRDNVFILRKMVEEVFTVLYSEAVGKSSLVPVPYDWIQKDPGCVVAHGLPDGVALKRPSEYDTPTLMKILELSHRIHFTVKRQAEDPSREVKSGSDVNPNSSTAAMTQSGHGPGKPPPPPPLPPPAVTSPSPAPSTSSVLSNFLYGMPMSSKPHPDGLSLLHMGKDRLAGWTDKNAVLKDSIADEAPGQSSPSVHISKRLLFSIVHEKSEKWDSFIRETEDINTLRECVQILFNSRYAEALGLDHMVPVPYRKMACDPGAVEIIGIPDQIPFKRPCTYGVPKLKRILDQRHGIRFIVRRMFDERIFTAAGRMVRDEGRLDLTCTADDGFPDLNIIGTTELLGSKSTSACVSPLDDCEAGTSSAPGSAPFPVGPSTDCVPVRRIKTEPPDRDLVQLSVPEVGASGEESSDPEPSGLTPRPAPPPASPCPPSTPAPAPPPCTPHHTLENHAAEVSPGASSSQSVRRTSEGSLVDDIGEMILQLRRQVDSLFSIKYAEALGLPEPAKVPYSRFQMFPEDLFVTGLPDGVALRRPHCFGAAKLRKILAVSSQIHFVIKRPELLAEPVKQEMPSMPLCDPELDAADLTPLTDDSAALSKRPGFSECLESKLSRIDLANTLREQVQDLFNRKYGEALGIKYPVQVPYKRIKNNPDSVIIQGLPPGIPFRKPCTFGSQNLERILAVADKISFTITRPFQGLIPKPAPRRVTLLKKAYASISDEDDMNRMGEKVVLREQVKELFNRKYGEALGLDRSVSVPYKLIRGNPEALEVCGLPDDVSFRNPNSYDIVSLEKILQTADKLIFSIKSPLQPFAELCSQPCNTGNTAGSDASINRRKRKRVQESSRVAPPPSDLLSSSQIPVMQWPMYMVDYSGVNMQLPGKVNY